MCEPQAALPLLKTKPSTHGSAISQSPLRSAGQDKILVSSAHNLTTKPPVEKGLKSPLAANPKESVVSSKQIDDHMSLDVGQAGAASVNERADLTEQSRVNPHRFPRHKHSIL